MEVVGIIFAVIVGAIIYFIPTFVAFGRHHRNRGAILALNLLLPGIGWIIGLVWALTN